LFEVFGCADLIVQILTDFVFSPTTNDVNRNRLAFEQMAEEGQYDLDMTYK